MKTNKAVLQHEVEKTFYEQTKHSNIDFNSHTVVSVDAMVLIQQQQFPETFGEFSASILKQLLSLARRYNAKRLDFVTDRYKNMSIKQSEHQRRAAHGKTKFQINGPDQKMPKLMNKFLASGDNKE